MIINVTKKNIVSGKMRSDNHCPIALAILDKKYVFNTSVGTDTIYVHREIGKNVTMTVYKMPNKAIQFIKNFDNGRPVEPIKFTLKKKKEGGIL